MDEEEDDDDIYAPEEGTAPEASSALGDGADVPVKRDPADGAEDEEEGEEVEEEGSDSVSPEASTALA